MPRSDEEASLAIDSPQRILPKQLHLSSVAQQRTTSSPSPTNSGVSISSRAETTGSIISITPITPTSARAPSTAKTTPDSAKSFALPIRKITPISPLLGKVQSSSRHLAERLLSQPSSSTCKSSYLVRDRSKQSFIFNDRVRSFADRASSLMSQGQVTKVFNLIRSIQDHTLKNDKDLIRRRLTSFQYEQLLARVAEDQNISEFWEEKLRYDYTHEDSELVIRMPDFVHDVMVAEIHEAIFGPVRAFREAKGNIKARAAELAKGIREYRSSSLAFPSISRGYTNEKSPDNTYGHKDCKSGYPGLILEVGYSKQSLRDLYVLAERYIRDSKGETRTVVGVDIGYIKGKPGGNARFAIWRAGIGEDSTKAVLFGSEGGTVFRNSERETIIGADLKLLLTDLVCPNMAESFADVVNAITISAETLCQALTEGEEKHFQMKATKHGIEEVKKTDQQRIRDEKLTELGSRPRRSAFKHALEKLTGGG